MVTLLIGLPASGKSTYATEVKPDLILSSDKIREELYGDESRQGNPAEVFSVLYERMEKAIDNGNGSEHIIIDATNMSKRDRSKAIEIAKGGNHIIRAVVMDTPIAVCIRRNDARERKVPDFVFDRMLRKYEEPSLSEGFDIIERKKG